MKILLKPVSLMNKILCKLGIHNVWYIEGCKPSNYCRYCGKEINNGCNSRSSRKIRI